jgi:hypothetical protein
MHTAIVSNLRDVSASDLRAHAQVFRADHDGQLDLFVRGARGYAEQRTNRLLRRVLYVARATDAVTSYKIPDIASQLRCYGALPTIREVSLAAAPVSYTFDGYLVESASGFDRVEFEAGADKIVMQAQAPGLWLAILQLGVFYYDRRSGREQGATTIGSPTVPESIAQQMQAHRNYVGIGGWL